MRRSIFFCLSIILLGISFTILAQDDDEPIMQISVAGVTCDLAIETGSEEAETEAESTEEPEMESTEEAETEAESTEEPEMESTEEPQMETTEEPEMESTEEASEESDMDDDSASDNTVITLSDDCANVIPQLRVAQNGTLWIALSTPGEDEWQEFGTVDGEDYDPQFDRRGRFVGCQIPEEGAQVCRVTWVQGDVTYVIEIPLVVGDAFVSPSSNTSSSSSSEETTSSEGDGEWGVCGSCSGCGANANLCVTSPDGQCVADPGRCDVRSSSGAPGPATTEEP